LRHNIRSKISHQNSPTQRKRIGLRARVFPESTTAQYACVFDSKGELLSAVADMTVLEKIPAELVNSNSSGSPSSNRFDSIDRSILICDGNLHPENCMKKLVAFTNTEFTNTDSSGTAGTTAANAGGSSISSPIWFDPVSVPKAIRYFALPPAMTELIAPNHDELEALIQGLQEMDGKMDGKGNAKGNATKESQANSSDKKQVVRFYAERVRQFLRLERNRRGRSGPAVVLTCGDRGCLITSGRLGVSENESKTSMRAATDSAATDSASSASRFSSRFSRLDSGEYKPFVNMSQKSKQNLSVAKRFTNTYKMERIVLGQGTNPHLAYFSLQDQKKKKLGQGTAESLVLWHVQRKSPLEKIVNCTGAGDTLLGATACAFVYREFGLLEAVVVRNTNN
jgi:hypothetical protein